MVRPVTFKIEKKLPHTQARAGVISTLHGEIPTPAFVVVGTKASVKSLLPTDLTQYVKNTVTMGNTYHLFLQPGADIIEAGGGLNAFTSWTTPTMTDSGGFQVFSLGAAFGAGVSKFASNELAKHEDAEPSRAPRVFDKDFATNHGKLCVIDEDGVTFTSHIDGSLHRFTAERSIEIQHKIGADIIIAFDECTSPTASYAYQKEAMDRTHRWAKRSILAHKQNFTALQNQGLYGVVQGGRYTDLRAESARVISRMDFDGFGIGGSFSKEDLGEALSTVNDILPEDKPRHLLGIGFPEDIVDGVLRGCDTFDCVAPTRIGRTGSLYVKTGRIKTTPCGTFTYPETTTIHIKNQKYVRDFSPLDPLSDMHTARSYTKAYLAHLFRSHEMLGPHIASIHNLAYIVNFTKNLREQILRA